MELKQNILDELKGKNPFKVPDGYFEGLTEQIMAQIPDASYKEPKVVSLLDRVRPWLYLAGAVAGLLLIFKVFYNPVTQGNDDQPKELYVQAFGSGEMLQVISEEDMEYLEFLENQYFDRLFSEEIDGFEELTDNME
jgi:hypothetical protein